MSKVSPDLTGQRFGFLVALREDGRNISNVLWLCQCDCGNTIRKTVQNLRQTFPPSCGCNRKKYQRCTVDGCSANQRCAGLCRSHYAEKKRKEFAAKPKVALTPERLRELVCYDPETGVFTRVAGNRSDLHGHKARPTGKDKYPKMALDGVKYSCHRLAWFWVHKEWPQEEVDHINGDRTDNRISNLRAVSRLLNAQNIRTLNRKNTSGFTGVSFAKDKGKWVVRIKTPGKYRHVGYFSSKEEAGAAYVEAKRRFHEGCTL